MTFYRITFFFAFYFSIIKYDLLEKKPQNKNNKFKHRTSTWTMVYCNGTSMVYFEGAAGNNLYIKGVAGLKSLANPDVSDRYFSQNLFWLTNILKCIFLGMRTYNERILFSLLKIIC